MIILNTPAEISTTWWITFYEEHKIIINDIFELLQQLFS